MFVHQFNKGPAAYTVLLLHGTGGDENDLVPIAKSLAPGASLLSPRGQVSERGALRFFRRISPGAFDLDDIKLRAADLSGFVTESAAKYALDPARIYALGYSNGANIAHAVMLLHPGVLAGGVLLRPMPVMEAPVGVDLQGIPVLIAAGDEDIMTTPELTHRLATDLTNACAKVEVNWVAAGHELTPYDFKAAQLFFQAHGGKS